MTRTPKDIMSSYFAALRAKDFDEVENLLSDDFSATGPAGETTDVKYYIEAIKKIFSTISDIEVQHMWVDGNDVITWVVVHMINMPSAFNLVIWSRIVNDKITQVKVTFDPRSSQE